MVIVDDEKYIGKCKKKFQVRLCVWVWVGERERGREREEGGDSWQLRGKKRAEGVPWWTARQPWERETLLHGGAFTFTNYSPPSRKTPPTTKKKRFKSASGVSNPPAKKATTFTFSFILPCCTNITKKKGKRKRESERERSYIKVRVLVVYVSLFRKQFKSELVTKEEQLHWQVWHQKA